MVRAWAAESYMTPVLRREPPLPRSARSYGAHKALVNRLWVMVVMVFLPPQDTQRRVPQARPVGIGASVRRGAEPGSR